MGSTRRAALCAAALAGLALLSLPALVLWARGRPAEAAGTIRRDSLVVVPHLPSPDPHAPARWLRTDEITSDPELAAEVDWMASGSFVHWASVSVATCATSRGDYQAEHPMQPQEEAVLALRERIKSLASPRELRALSHHEAPVVRAFFAPHLRPNDEDVAWLPALLSDATCVPIWHRPDEPERDCVVVAHQVAWVGCELAMNRGGNPLGGRLLDQAAADPAAVAMTWVAACLMLRSVTTPASFRSALVASGDEERTHLAARLKFWAR